MRSPHRYALAGLAALALLAAGCSSSSSPSSSGGTSWATVSSATAGGGMAKLIAAAKKEGTLNVIALPPTWANYGTIISTFEKKYGIKVNSANPTGSSQDEVNAVKQENGTAAAPDVLDVGMSVATANTSLFAPYEVSTWSSIPAAQKASNGLWYQPKTFSIGMLAQAWVGVKTRYRVVAAGRRPSVRAGGWASGDCSEARSTSSTAAM